MEAIGYFQLENLILSRSPFLFLDVSTEKREAPPEPLAKYLSAAVRLKPEEANAYLQKMGVTKERPVLLVSEDERASAAVARDLEAAGFTNVYIIAGGVTGLLSEV